VKAVQGMFQWGERLQLFLGIGRLSLLLLLSPDEFSFGLLFKSAASGAYRTFDGCFVRSSD
jgi:hypothetical protein